MEDKELSIIIVSYNTRDLLRNCIRSIIKTAGTINYEIIIVDNASNDKTAETVEKEFSVVKIIHNKENLGFAKANNQGLKIATGDNILILNSDTIVLNECLHKILSFVRNNSSAGVVGCRVLNEDRSLQYSFFHNPNILTEVIFFSKTIIKNIWDPISCYNRLRYWNHHRVREVDWVTGCFFWVQKKVFEKVGLLDENFFMYYEDAEFCFRVKKHSDYKIYYFPEASVIHLHGASSTEEIRKYTEIQRYYQSSRCYLHKCYGEKAASIFKKICSTIWRVEMSIFYLFRKHKKFNKKFILLKELLKT